MAVLRYPLFSRPRLHVAVLFALLVWTAAGPPLPPLLAQGPAPPVVGTRAPEFTLAAIDGSRVSLTAELARGPVVLIMGRGWVGYQCPLCNRQFGDFLRHAAEIDAAGARVLWVYPGPGDQVQRRAEEFAAGQTIPAHFRFLLDPDYAFTVRYGLRWNAPNETAYPATFVIDRGGVVRFARTSRSHGDRVPAADVLAVLAALTTRSAAPSPR